MPTRRDLMAAGGASIMGLADTGGASANTPVHDEAYFSSIQASLHAAGFFAPTLVVDRDRLLANIIAMQRMRSSTLDFRIVVKSLPSPELIQFIMDRTGSYRLMDFHRPFLSDAAERWPQVDILLGKPLPVGAAAAFYAGRRASRLRPERQVHWLIDTVERLAQYRAFANQSRRNLSIALEIDVGFHRGGFASPRSVGEALEIIKAEPRLHFAGFMGYDAHITIFEQQLGPQHTSLSRVSSGYSDFIAAARAVDQSFGDSTSRIFNTGGSTTFPLYRDGGAVTPCNEVAAGSGMLKPTFCDRALPDLLPAVFIAAPVLKVLEGVSVPGLESDPRGGATDAIERARTTFVYGGRWMAEPVWPRPLSSHPVFGRSSNQDMFTMPASVRLAPDDYVFLRPNQTEGVLLQFGNIAVYSDGAIVDVWSLLQQT